jgi:hypothetical protein
MGWARAEGSMEDGRSRPWLLGRARTPVLHAEGKTPSGHGRPEAGATGSQRPTGPVLARVGLT